MIEIIPAMDLIDGKCVRLNQGDFRQKTVYCEDPLETAKRFAGAGLRRLHLVDLDGALSGSPKHLSVLEQIAAQTNLAIGFSGGLKSGSDVKVAFSAGAALISVGTVAVRDAELLSNWISDFDARRILLAADTLNGKIAVQGWQEHSAYAVSDFLKYWQRMGISSAICTSIACDGMLRGPDLNLYQELCKQLPELGLIASGGVRSIGDIEQLDRIGCSGVIIGKALYNGSISLEELTQMNSACL